MPTAVGGLGKGPQVEPNIVSPGLIPGELGVGGSQKASEHAGFQVGVVTKFPAYLFWGHLSIFIEIHVFKQAGCRILVPHKQVACGQAILSGYQLHLK